MDLRSLFWRRLTVDGLGEMWTLRHLILLNLFLVLGGPAFTQSLAQNVDKAPPPDKAQAATEREKTLLADVTTSAQWPPTDPRVVKSYQDLADFYSSQGRYAEAEKQFAKRLELAEDALGRANPALIPAVNDLARVNFAQMKYARAEELYERSLRIMEREYGDNDAKLIPEIEAVAQVYESDAKYPEAERFLRRAIAIRERAGGADSASTSPDLLRLAHISMSRQNTAAAVNLYQRVLAIQQKATPNGPELLPVLDALAGIALDQKRTADAETLLRQTLSIREGSVGPMHPDVAANLDRLGALLTDQKRYPEAVRVYERSLFLWMKALKPESPELLDKYEMLAEVYAALDRPVDAEPLVLQVLAAREKDTVASLNTLAAVYVAKNELNGAEPLYRLSLSILDKRGLLSTRRAPSAADTNLDLLAQTASDYCELLKKMRRKPEAAKLEARIRQITGKPASSPAQAQPQPKKRAS